MAENKKAVILYADWLHTFEELTDEEAGKLIKHFFRYVNDKNPEAPDRVTKLLFQPIKAQLKRDLEKWETIKAKRKEAGKVSADKRQQNQQVLTNADTCQQEPTNSTVNVNVNDTVNVNVNDNSINTISDFQNGKSLYNNFIASYDSFCKKRLSVGAKVDGAQGKALNSIISYLKTQVKDKNNLDVGAHGAWCYILNNWDCLEPFVASQIKLTQINSNILLIINQLKNATGNKHKAANASVVDGLIAEIK